jgi:Protein of unknown function (DUF4236)
MSFRFHRSMKLFPGVRLNFGKRGIGISAGVPGLRVGVDSRGKGYTSAGIPGTGLSVRKYAKKGDSPETQANQNAAVIGVLIGLGILVVFGIIAALSR